MSPMKFNQTSKKTIKVGSSLDDLPQSMARTFLSSSGGNQKENTSTQLRQDVKVAQDEGNQDCKCKCADHDAKQEHYRTQLNFSSEHGSELKGWEQMPKTINITLQSTMGKSTFDQTMYNTNMQQKKIGQGAIRIEHSPSMNIIYAKDPKGSKHIHKKTQQRAIEARTISLEPNMTMSTLNKNGVPMKRYSQKSHPVQKRKEHSYLSQIQLPSLKLRLKEVYLDTRWNLG